MTPASLGAALVASALVNLLLGTAVVLLLRDHRRRERRAGRAAGTAPAAGATKRDRILTLARRGASRERLVAATGASPGEVELVLRLEGLDRRPARSAQGACR